MNVDFLNKFNYVLNKLDVSEDYLSNLVGVSYETLSSWKTVNLKSDRRHRRILYLYDFIKENEDFSFLQTPEHILDFLHNLTLPHDIDNIDNIDSMKDGRVSVINYILSLD